MEEDVWESIFFCDINDLSRLIWAEFNSHRSQIHHAILHYINIKQVILYLHSSSNLSTKQFIDTGN